MNLEQWRCFCAEEQGERAYITRKPQRLRSPTSLQDVPHPLSTLKIIAGETDRHAAGLRFATFLKEHYGPKHSDGPPAMASGGRASSMQSISEDAADAEYGSYVRHGLTPLMFYNLLLDRPNRAACAHKAEDAVGALDRPMLEYYVSASHNT